MSDDEQDVIVAEIVDSDNLPALVTHERAKPIGERDWTRYSTPERRCTAHSSRTGEQCKNVAIKGSNVCRFHGGAAKQIKRAARVRIENAADRMAKQLLGIALSADSEAVMLAAVKDALDRAGLKPTSEIVLSPGESKPYEEVFDSIAGGSRAESHRARGFPVDAEAESIEPQSFTFDGPEAQSAPRAAAPTQPPREPTFDREVDARRAGRCIRPAHSGMDAIAVAAELRRQQEELPGGHMRYRAIDRR